MKNKDIKFSLGFKLILPISVIFFMAMAVSSWFFSNHQRQQAEQNIVAKVEGLTTTFFDSLNAKL